MIYSGSYRCFLCREIVAVRPAAYSFSCRPEEFTCQEVGEEVLAREMLSYKILDETDAKAFLVGS